MIPETQRSEALNTVPKRMLRLHDLCIPKKRPQDALETYGEENEQPANKCEKLEE